MYMEYKKILESWIEYLELEKLHNLKIDASKLPDKKRQKFGETIKLQNNILNFNLTPPLTENKDKIEIYFGFPILEEKRNFKTKYIPLFIIKRELQVLVNEEGKNVYKFEFDTEVESDFYVAKPVLARILELEPREIDELIKKKPLLTLLKDLLISTSTGEIISEDLSFNEAFSRFKEWISHKLPKNLKVTNFDAVLTTEKEFEYFEGQKVEKMLHLLSKKQFFSPPSKSSIAYKYLYEKSTLDFKNYNTPSNVPWFGTFHDFSLSKGQALLLQKKAEGENLIAVQGPPGTGKTTVLMAVIASTLVERALKIAKGEKDFSTIILVTSTANKAVENAAREFSAEKGIPKGFKDIPLYFQGNGFYFLGGKRENIEKSLSRLENLVEFLRKCNFDPKEYIKAKNNLLIHYNHLKKKVKEVEIILQLIGELEETEKELTKIKREIKDLLHQLNWNEEIHYLEKIKEWIKKVEKESINFSIIEKLTDEELIDEIIELKLFLQKCSLKDKFLDIFFGKIRKRIFKFTDKYRRLLKSVGFNFSSNSPKILEEQLLKLEELSQKASSLLEEKPDFLLISQIDLWKKLLSLKEIEANLQEKVSSIKNSIEDKLGEKKNILEKLEELDFLTLWNYLTVDENRYLFIKATHFLFLEAVRRKEEIVKTLENFKLLMNGDNKAKDFIREISIEEFFKNLSLLYPVHFSSLHSSPYLFANLIEFLKENMDFKPIYLLYIDEAAMALPHLSYPALYFSEKAIAVGDPLQLEPVVSVPEAEIEIFHEKFYQNNQKLISRFSPARTSTYHRSARCETGNYDDFGMACFLDTHRRCQKPIAELFKDVAGYQMLKIATPELKGKSKEKLEKAWNSNLGFIDVLKGERKEKNTNLTEVRIIEELIKHLQNSGYDRNDIIVITPFVRQEKLLKNKLRKLVPREKIGTIHKFQGQEAPVVIMSTVIQEGDSTAFIDSKPNLLNVAISRAKHLFIMVGSKECLVKKTNYFKKAIRKIEKDGICKQDKEFLIHL